MIKNLERISTEKQTDKLAKQIQSGMSEYGTRFLKLIELIPNWQTYLTIKQLESAELYVKCLDATDVDYKLNINNGTTQQRLFGSSKSRGAIGRLEDVYTKLEKQGYFKKQEKVVKHNKKAVSKISQKTKDKIRELIKLVVEIPDYENYLTKSQVERINIFLQLRSIKACARHFSITETTFKQSLLGRNDRDVSGILGKLRSAYRKTTVSEWGDI